MASEIRDQIPEKSHSKRSSDHFLAWFKEHIGLISFGFVIVGALAGLWYKLEYVTLVVNPDKVVEWRERSVKKECRAKIVQCFTEPNLTKESLWVCLNRNPDY